MIPDSESVLDRLEALERWHAERNSKGTLIDVAHLRALLDVARAAERTVENANLVCDEEIELERALRALTTPSEQKEET